MKRLTFTGVIVIDDEDAGDPAAFVDMALRYGHKHQDFYISHVGEILVEDAEEDE